MAGSEWGRGNIRIHYPAFRLRRSVPASSGTRLPQPDSPAPKVRPKRKRHVLRTVMLSLTALFLLAVVGGYFYFDVPNWQPLDMSKLTAVKQTGALLDRDGNVFGTLVGTENRVVLPLADIPAHVRGAFIAAEDVRFYTHFGVDIQRILGAVVANLRAGSYAEGASTITQQLIKLSHLSTRKTLARKLEEAWLAIELERVSDKDEILEMYLNYIYFGRGAYGVQAAAQAYFGVDASALTAAQAACLASIIKAPSLYAPHLNEQANRTRRGYVLATMRDIGVLSESEYTAAAGETIEVIERTEENIQYGWFTDAVLGEAESLLSISAEAVLSGGYRILTTLDPVYQDIADAQYEKSSLFPASAADGVRVESGFACVDVHSGAVRALVGGRAYETRRGLNRATQIRRQPGSALKPIAVYAPALDVFGYHAASVLDDSPRDFGNYKPRNSGNAYYGFVSVRTALKYSLNVSTVGLLKDIGVEAARAYMARVGLEVHNMDANLSLALGSMTYGVSPVQLAAAYAPFANGGLYYEPYLIERITDAQGVEIYRRSVKAVRALSEQTAYLMTSLLQSVTQSGTGSKLSQAGTPVAGKTGTVNMTGGGNRDVWMAAYNSDISTATWMGFDEPDASHKMQGWVSGGDYPAALATAFFKAAYTGRDKPSFRQPAGLISLEIDKKSIEWAGEAMLATRLTPTAYRYTETFSSANHPTKESTVWRAPRTPQSFYVTHNDAGNPVLVVTPTDTALYRIQRDAVGEWGILTELSGTAGQTFYYTDTTARVGVVYTYRVIPVHQELLNNGVLLEGTQAVQIAQAKPAGGARRLLDMWLFGTSTDSDTDDLSGWLAP